MYRVLCATTNDIKFGIGTTVCASYDIALIQTKTNVEEIQGENAENIIRRKAEDVYAVVRAPVLVSDDSWEIPALKGFPGPYMKSMNAWLTPDDFVRLMRPLQDRRVFLHQRLAYYDGTELKIFHHPKAGILLHEARGRHGEPSAKLIALDHDNGLSIAEVYDSHRAHTSDRLLDRQDVWHKFAVWYVARMAGAQKASS